MCDVYIPIQRLNIVIAGLILFMFPGKAPMKGNQGSPSASKLYVTGTYGNMCMHVIKLTHCILYVD